MSSERRNRLWRIGRGLAAVLLGLAVAACASSSSPTARQDSPPSRARCVSDLDKQPGTINRPLFFLFCVESP
jgi:hypothetical protein